MKFIGITVLGIILLSLGLWAFKRKAEPKDRVKTAYKEKKAIIENKLKEKNLKLEDIHILFVAYKAEKQLTIYVKNKQATQYNKLISYDICASSGDLGPKRKSGDYQVPEGFYHIDRFNPASSYYLSLGVNYPNSSDKIKSTAKDLGGDIFIHGACVTIGCMPMTNDKIKEIYIYALEAKNNGQNKIPIYIFPFKMTHENIKKYKSSYADHTSFWENLKVGYDKFHQNYKELSFNVDKNGDYQFK
ncbi:MAG: L,D-transpeptidase family protein [Raineya sp.]|jgi:murein L,D-transpeptidase YafK|nr:L,D-transpeptidase family protein [Raineya sp.]